MMQRVTLTQTKIIPDNHPTMRKTLRTFKILLLSPEACPTAAYLQTKEEN